MDFIESYLQRSFEQRYGELPRRIFLDSNIIQYLCDFGDFIFESYSEESRLISSSGKEIPNDSFLYREIICLNEVFGIPNRVPFQFATSNFIYEEVLKKYDLDRARYFFEIWNHWQYHIKEMKGDAFKGYGKRKLARIQSDKSIIAGLSKSDFQVLCDALLLESDVLLTCDRYRNRQSWVYSKYRIMILYPSDFFQIIREFQALWC